MLQSQPPPNLLSNVIQTEQFDRFQVLYFEGFFLDRCVLTSTIGVVLGGSWPSRVAAAAPGGSGDAHTRCDGFTRGVMDSHAVRAGCQAGEEERHSPTRPGASAPIRAASGACAPRPAVLEGWGEAERKNTRIKKHDQLIGEILFLWLTVFILTGASPPSLECSGK